MEKLLKKYVNFKWDDECQRSLDTLKQNMVTPPILVFLYCTKEFHVHVDASPVALGLILTQAMEGAINHLSAFAIRKFPTA